MAIRSKTKTSNGMRGLAEVRVLNDYLRVIFKADGDTYQVRKDGWDRESGVYNVTLSKANDEIQFVSPPSRGEPYLVKFLEFANRVGASDTNPGVPEPKIEPGGPRQGRGGQTYYAEDRLVARAKLVVVEKGPYKGLNIIYTLPYIFAQDDMFPSLTLFEGTQGQRKVLETFLTTAGLDLLNDEIPWSGNVLPYLESKLQAADRIFTVRLNEKGFVDKEGIAPIPSYLITPEMLGEEDAPKKAKANGKAKVKAASRKSVAKKSK
jgi:hypothetical protein